MAGLRRAINDKCKDCAYDKLAPGTWRQQVHACTIEICPLWPVRPRSKGTLPQGIGGPEFVELEGKYGPYTALKQQGGDHG